MWTSVAAACFAIPTFLISMIFMMLLPKENVIRQWLMTDITPGLNREILITFLLATPVQFIIGSRFYIGAYKSLVKTRSANMDVLVALVSQLLLIHREPLLRISTLLAPLSLP
jgi:Cu+-exporting ATPase